MKSKPPINRSLIACGSILMAMGMMICSAEDRTSQNEPQLKAFLEQHPDADTNHDGILTVDEARAYMQKTQAQSPGVQAPSVPNSPAPPAGKQQSYAAYLQDPAGYQWTLKGKSGVSAAYSNTTAYSIAFTSQIWHGAVWSHQMNIFVPKNNIAPDIALIFVDSGLPDQPVAQAADEMGITCVAVGGMYQACFGAPTGGGVAAYGAQQFLKTGDPTWMIDAPAAKALIRTMDVLGELSAKEMQTPIKRFILTGHSKMGMACWWAASSDPRVKGIIPVGADMLNVSEQPNTLATLAKALGGLQGDAGLKFLSYFDPYTNRQKLTAPKLIISGADDESYDLDAVNRYWDGLPGPKWHLYLDNARHMQEPRHPKSIQSTGAFVRAVALGKELPDIQWKFTDEGGKIRVEAGASVPAKGARLWSSTTTSHFDGGSVWTDQPMSPAADSKSFSGEIAETATQLSAAYAELEFEQDGKTYSLTTAVHITKPGGNPK